MMSTNILFSKVCYNAQQCNVLPLHLKQTFPPIIQFSLKEMGSDPDYLLKSFLLQEIFMQKLCIAHLKYINLGQEANHCSINENFTVDNCREKVQRFQDKTNSIFDFGIRCRIHTKYDCMYAIKQTQPFPAFRTLPSDIVKPKHHVLDQKLDLKVRTNQL